MHTTFWWCHSGGCIVVSRDFNLQFTNDYYIEHFFCADWPAYINFCQLFVQVLCPLILWNCLLWDCNIYDIYTGYKPLSDICVMNIFLSFLILTLSFDDSKSVLKSSSMSSSILFSCYRIVWTIPDHLYFHI